MSRVIESERDAEARIAACEHRCEDQIEEARAARRVMLERAQVRIVALHARAAEALNRRTAAILAQSRQGTGAAATTAQPQERIEAALTRLVTYLILDTPRADGH
jgi:hypothetical protein